MQEEAQGENGGTKTPKVGKQKGRRTPAIRPTRRSTRNKTPEIRIQTPASSRNTGSQT